MTRQTGGSRTPGIGLAGALALAGEYADELVLGTARDMHGAIATRTFRLTNKATGGAARGTQAIHDGISKAVYAGVGVGIRAVAAGLHSAERRGLGPGIETSAGGRHVVSAVHGLVGDRLSRERPEYAIDMAVRSKGRDLRPLDRDTLHEAFPRAGSDLVVFLHGLGENDDSWNLKAELHGGSYGSRLEAETGWTAVYLRANTGLPLAENGVALAGLLEHLVALWPTDVRRIALVGHSMGGLIMRAACAVVTDAQQPWTSLVTNIITLGSPHLGAPLERMVSLGARALGMLPESAPIGRILEFRSVGILDLRRGLPADVQHLPHARYHLVAATVGASPRHPVSAVFGDLLVRYPSAVGRSRGGHELLPEADILHVPGADHFALLNHPRVYTAMKQWLA